MRRLVGNRTGASLPLVLRLYVALVRPILEYCSSIWDCEKQSYKYELDAIQRAALLAASGAPHTTSSDSLHVYCSIQPLDDRREAAAIATMERAARLDLTHPLREHYELWRNRGSPLSNHSVFVRAATASALLRRFCEIGSGGDDFAEPLPRDHIVPTQSKRPARQASK